ncbi:hypothetical protein ACLOJK_002724 [Asimina triloba]
MKIAKSQKNGKTNANSPFLSFKCLKLGEVEAAWKSSMMTLTELEEAKAHLQRSPACILDASSYVGFHTLRGLLDKGYAVHAAVQSNGKHPFPLPFLFFFGWGLELVCRDWVVLFFGAGKAEMVRRIKEMSCSEERLVVFVVDVLDYHSILEALKGCSALFCCLDCSSDGYDEGMADLEVRGVINVVEACAQTESVQKMVFTSSLTAGIWRENICSEQDVDERCWSDAEFCRKKKLWYALAKTQSEQAAWALAMDRMVNMVSINAGLILGPSVVHHNPGSTMSYLKGAAQMCENGLLAIVDVKLVVDAHIRALEEESACGRYFCFNRVLTTEEDAINLATTLTPLIPLPHQSQECRHDAVIYQERLRNKKLSKLVEGVV